MKAKHPYTGYLVYKVWHSKQKRAMAVLYKSKNDRTTIAWARYVLSVKLGRRLSKLEEADHKDNDKTNDAPGNLQVLSGVANRQKYAATIRKEHEYVCPTCKIPFISKVSLDWKKTAPCCSRKCGYVQVSIKLSNKQRT